MALTGDMLVALATGSDVQDASGTTGSTTYTATLTGGTACGVAFIAPASGQVLIHNTVFVAASAGINAFASARVRVGGTIGSGADVVAASDTNAVIPPSGSYLRGTSVVRVTGLTPGSIYNAQGVYRLDAAGTLTVRDKVMVVSPCL